MPVNGRRRYMINVINQSRNLITSLCRFAIVIITIVSVSIISEAASAGEVKVVLFCAYDGKECFLSESQVAQFARVIHAAKAINKGVEGKPIPQEFIFYYWDYDRAVKEMKRNSISFNSNGGSVYWHFDDKDSAFIRTLLKDLTSRAKP